MQSSILEYLDTFLHTWWNKHNNSEVYARDLLPIALEDPGFLERFGDLGLLEQRARIGSYIFSLSRKPSKSPGPFRVQKERRHVYRLIKETAALAWEPPEESPFGWLPSPQEYPVVALIKEMRALGCSFEAVSKALNEDQRFYRGQPWTVSLVEKVLAFTNEHEDFVFRSGGSGPGVEANDPSVSSFYLETPSLGRVLLRHDAHLGLTKLACEKDQWAWRSVLRGNKVEELEVPAAVTVWICGCLQAVKEAPPQELAGVLDGLARKILMSR